MILSFGLLVFLLALHLELLGNTQSLQKHPLFFLELQNHKLLPLPLLQLLLEPLLFVLFELLQFVKKVVFSLLLGLNVLNTDFIGLLSVLFFHVLSLDLVEQGVLLRRIVITVSFSLNCLDSSPILWFMRVITIFLL